jgi:hypothetical protein
MDGNDSTLNMAAFIPYVLRLVLKSFNMRIFLAFHALECKWHGRRVGGV